MTWRPMLGALLLALGLPLVLLLATVAVLERNGGALPAWLGALRRHASLIWVSAMVLIIGVSLLRWLLNR